MRALYPTGVNSEFGVVANKPVVTTIVSDTTTTTTTTGTVTTDGSGTTITTGGGSVVIGTDNSVTINGTPTTGTVVTNGGVTTITTGTGSVITVTPVGGGGVIVDTSTTGHTETPVIEVHPDSNLPVTVAKFKSPCRVDALNFNINVPIFYCSVALYDGSIDTITVSHGVHTYTKRVDSPTQNIFYDLEIYGVTVSFSYIRATGETVVTLVGCTFSSKTFDTGTGETTVITHTKLGHIVKAIGILSTVTTTDNTPIILGDSTPDTPPIIGDSGGTPITNTDLNTILTSLGISFEPKIVLLTNKNVVTDTLITVGEPTDPVITPTDPPTPVPPIAVNEVKSTWTMYFPVKVGGFIFALNSYDSGTETTGAMQLVKFDATTLAFISQVRISNRRIHWLSAYGGNIYSIGIPDVGTNPTSNLMRFCKFDTDLNVLEDTNLPGFYSKWAHPGDSTDTSVGTWGIIGDSPLTITSVTERPINVPVSLVDWVAVGDYIYGVPTTHTSKITFNRWGKYSGARDMSFEYDMGDESLSNRYHQVHTDGRYIVFGAANIQVYDTVSNSIVYSRPRNTYHMSKAAHFMAPGKLVIVVNDLSYDQRNVIAAYSLIVTL